MPVKLTIRTPLGVFSTVKQAAEAMGVDRSTIVKRCETDPENYSRTEISTPRRPRETKQFAVRGVRWPISWAQYRLQDHDTREEIWEQWYHTRGLDPEAESTVEQFFDEMDTVPESDLTDTESTEDEADQQHPI